VQEHIDNPASFGTVSPSAYFRCKGQSIAAFLAISLPYILTRPKKAVAKARFAAPLEFNGLAAGEIKRHPEVKTSFAAKDTISEAMRVSEPTNVKVNSAIRPLPVNVLPIRLNGSSATEAGRAHNPDAVSPEHLACSTRQ
jgi:hypothetical protein